MSNSPLKRGNSMLQQWGELQKWSTLKYLWTKSQTLHFIKRNICTVFVFASCTSSSVTVIQLEASSCISCTPLTKKHSHYGKQFTDAGDDLQKDFPVNVSNQKWTLKIKLNFEHHLDFCHYEQQAYPRSLAHNDKRWEQGFHISKVSSLRVKNSYTVKHFCLVEQWSTDAWSSLRWINDKNH